jgi:hypothetical protein
MSERICAWLVRLFPSRFRKAYGEDALQLYRDRLRDERGLVWRTRLWFDLLLDLAVSVPREYRQAEPALLGASAQPGLDGMPGFRLLEGAPPGPGALLSAVFLAMVGLAAASVLINYGGSHPNSHLWQAKPRAQQPDRSAATGSPSSSPGGRSAASAQGQTASAPPTNSMSGLDSEDGVRVGVPPSQSNQAAGQQEAQAPAAKAARAGSQTAVAGAAGVPVNAAERRRVINGAVANLKRYYDRPDVGRKVADALLAYESRGDDNEVTDADTFAVVLNQQMLDVSHDGQLRIRYYVNGVPAQRTGPTAEALAQYRRELEESNCFFSKVEVLPHNIGYLKLDSFPDPAICGATAAKAMASLNGTNAIIFDLRENAGGFPKMVALIAGYLFDRPTHLNDMYDRGENSKVESWTPAPVAGNKLADKPAYVLTSSTTFSGAEEFSYDLKMLKRATIVGEPTSGRGHIPFGRRIDDHFEIRVPDRRSINPISKTDWDGTGVLPDVKVKAADALETAVKLAEANLRKK